MRNNSYLTRFWFSLSEQAGVGVTAYSREDAIRLMHEAGYTEKDIHRFHEVVENVDIRTLDEHHIRSNMGPPNLRDIWFPDWNRK